MESLNEIVKELLPTLILAMVAAVGFGVRRAIKNFGKTELQIRMDAEQKALTALEAARKTPDPADDLPAEQAALLAQHKLDMARRLNSITDGLSEQAPKE